MEFRKGERKDTVVQRYRDRLTKPSGVVLVGVAQERASAWSATTQRRGPFVDVVYFRKSVYVNHYYIYFKTYTTRQMGYDLRRLIRKGLVTRLDHQKRYATREQMRNIWPPSLVCSPGLLPRLLSSPS